MTNRVPMHTPSELRDLLATVIAGAAGGSVSDGIGGERERDVGDGRGDRDDRGDVFDGRRFGPVFVRADSDYGEPGAAAGDGRGGNADPAAGG